MPVAVAGLSDFLNPATNAAALQLGCQFLNWLQDEKPMREWGGVMVNEHDFFLKCRALFPIKDAPPLDTRVSGSFSHIQTLLILNITIAIC